MGQTVQLKVKDMFSAGILNSLKMLMSLTLPYPAARKVQKIVKRFDEEKKIAQNHIDHLCEKWELSAIKPEELNEAQRSEYDTFIETLVDLEVSPIYSSEFGNSSISPVILQILENKVVFFND